MTIFPADILQFKKESAFIANNNILPITGYVKIVFTETGYSLFKSNLHMFYVKDFVNGPHHPLAVLVDSDTLYTFAAQTKDPIDINVVGDEIVLRSGKLSAANPWTDPKEFPVIASASCESFKLDAGLLAIADNFIVDNDLPVIQNHIFIGNGHMCASDGFIGFAHDVDEKIAPTVLRKIVSAGIPEKKMVDYWPGDSFHLVGITNGCAGFIKPEKTYQDIYPIFKSVDQPDFTLDKTEMIQFCQFCLGISKEKIVTARLWSDGAWLMLKMDDNAYQRKANKEIACDCVQCPPFNFNVEFMLRLLRAVPEDRVSFYPGNGRYLVRGFGDWVALIMGIVPKNQ